MDLQAFMKSFVDSINSIIECNILGISIFVWLALFMVLYLISSAFERKMR
jgi:hypothetical protein